MLHGPTLNQQPPTLPPLPPCASPAVLVTEACRSATPAQLGSVVMLLAHLANTQDHLKELPERAFKALAKVGAGVVVGRDVECQQWWGLGHRRERQQSPCGCKRGKERRCPEGG